MSRRKGATSEAELQDAIKRMNEKPEAKYEAHSRPSWREYLTNILGVNESAIESKKGAHFWEQVRTAVNVQEKERTGQPKPVERKKFPTPQQLQERNAKIAPVITHRDAKGRFTSVATQQGKVQVAYRDKSTGRFIKI